MEMKSILFNLLLISISVYSINAFNTSLNFKYSTNLKFELPENSDEIQVVKYNKENVYYIVYDEMFGNSDIYKLGLLEKYNKKYCSNGNICRIFAKPLKNAAVDNQLIINFIEYLDKDESLIKYFGNVEKISSGCQYSKAKYLTENDSESNINIDGIFYTDSSSKYAKKFKDTSIYFGADSEESPLARFEWIKFISIFYGKEAEATEIFDKIEKQYICNKDLILRNDKFTELRVAWIKSNSPLEQKWIIPHTEYTKNLLLDAGAKTSVEDSITSYDELHKSLERTHFLIDSSLSSIGEYSLDDFYDKYHYDSKSELLLLTHKNILRDDATRTKKGKSVWEEDYMAFPHLVLLDLLYWFHPRLFFENEKNYEIISELYGFDDKKRQNSKETNNSTINNIDTLPIKRGIYEDKQKSGKWLRNVALKNEFKTSEDTNCPTHLHSYVSKDICLSDESFSGDYDDYAIFDTVTEQLKNYAVLYYHIAGAIVVLSIIMSVVFYKIIKKRSGKKFNDSNKITNRNEGFVEIIEDY